MITAKISIIVPVYNVEKYLKKCLESLIHQTYKNIEIICVNDGSTDQSLDILYQYQNSDHRIKVIDQLNGGLSDARNTGLKHVSGQYIMFVDSDDWIDLETCEQSLNAMIRNQVDVVLWSYIREFGNKSLPKVIFNEDCYFNEEETKYQIYRRLFGLHGEELRHPENADAIVTAWGKLYKSKLIMDNDIQFVDVKTVGSCEDGLFNIEVFNHVKTAFFINQTYYHYRKDNESFTSSYRQDLSDKWHNLYDAMEDHIIENKLDISFQEALNNRIALSMIGLGLNILAGPGSFLKKRKRLKNLIKNNRIKKAIESLDISYFPIHWKVFFYSIKKRFCILVLLSLLIMNKMRGC